MDGSAGAPGAPTPDKQRGGGSGLAKLRLERRSGIVKLNKSRTHGNVSRMCSGVEPVPVSIDETLHVHVHSQA